MPVPCCHLLSLVVTDIENVMHAYFGMTWKEREATVSQAAWSSTHADTSSSLAVRAAVGKLQKQRSYSEIGFSTAGIAGIDFERHSGWGRDSLQRSHSDGVHGDLAKQEQSYHARHHGKNEQIPDATASELSATPGSVARASRKCHGVTHGKTPRRLRVGRELYAEESVQLRAVQEAMKATDSLAVANSDASEMVCHVNHVID